MLMTIGGRKNVKQRESNKIKERRIKGRERGPGLLIQKPTWKEEGPGDVKEQRKEKEK